VIVACGLIAFFTTATAPATTSAVKHFSVAPGKLKTKLLAKAGPSSD